MKCPNCGTLNMPSGKRCAYCGRYLRDPRDSSLSKTTASHVVKGRLRKGGLFAGKYRILAKLGKGGMGLVYIAEDARLKRRVAIKLLPPDFTRDEEARGRFIFEAQAASALDHPNICTIYEIDETGDGQMFIAMTYYGGETLKDRIARGPLAIADAVHIAEQVAKGLARAHEAGIIHQDIKPANIAVTERGEVKVLDFGLAKLAGEAARTKTRSPLGTVFYMSPEQARGDDVDHRTDIWSFGVMLYEMLTGDLPFVGDRYETVVDLILNSDPEPPTQRRADIPQSLELIVSRATKKDPSLRYQHIDDIVTDLEAVVAGIKSDRSITISRLPGVGAGLLSGARPVAVITFENQTGDVSYDYLKKVIPNLLITSLEQSRDLHVVTWERLQDLLKQMGRQASEVIDKDLGFELCLKEDIDTIVLGSFTKAGDFFATDVKVLDVRSKGLLGSASSRGEGVDSILKRQIDELSKEISKGIGVADHTFEQSKMPIAEVTTTSMDAYEYFLKGKGYYERLYNSQARDCLERAVEIDPAFAVAHLYLGWTYGRMRETGLRDAAYRTAMACSERTTKKERLYIEASYADILEHDVEKRARILRQIVNDYPREKQAHQLLAAYYRVRKRFYQAIEEYKRVLELDPGFGWAMNELGYMYADAGDFEKAKEYFERYAAVSPEDANPLDSMGELFFRMGDLDRSIATYGEALQADPDFYYSYWEIAYVYALKENYGEALRWIDTYIEKAPAFGIRAEGISWRGFYHFWCGRLDAALAEADRLSELAEAEGSLLWKNAAARLRGWVYYDMGDWDRSRRIVEACIETIGSNESAFAPPEKSYSLYTPDWIPRLVSAYALMLGLIDIGEGNPAAVESRLAEIVPYWPEHARLLEAELLLAEGSYDRAITLCEEAPSWEVPYMSDTDGMLVYNLPPMKDVLARAFVQKGALDIAIAEYTRLITVEPANPSRQLVHPRYHYSLAKTCEAKGRDAEARKHYGIFADLCRNSPPATGSR